MPREKILRWPDERRRGTAGEFRQIRADVAHDLGSRGTRSQGLLKIGKRNPCVAQHAFGFKVDSDGGAALGYATVFADGQPRLCPFESGQRRIIRQTEIRQLRLDAFELLRSLVERPLGSSSAGEFPDTTRALSGQTEVVEQCQRVTASWRLPVSPGCTGLPEQLSALMPMPWSARLALKLRRSASRSRIRSGSLCAADGQCPQATPRNSTPRAPAGARSPTEPGPGRRDGAPPLTTAELPAAP